MARTSSKKKANKSRRHKHHYTTPQKAKVQGAIQYLQAKGIPEDPRDIFNFFDMEERQGYRLIEPDAPSRTYHNQPGNETRGRKRNMTGAQVAQVSQLMEDTDLRMEAKGMGWHAVIWDLGLDIKSTKTICNTISKAFDYGKYKASLKLYMDERTQRDRWAWADTELLRRPNKEDFRWIRYSDEFHAGLGPEG